MKGGSALGSILFISVLSFFAVLGVYMILREIISARLCPSPESVVLSVRNCENNIEYTLRTLLVLYPKSRIIVEDDCSVDRTAEIVRRMARQYGRIHMK